MKYFNNLFINLENPAILLSIILDFSFIKMGPELRDKLFKNKPYGLTQDALKKSLRDESKHITKENQKRYNDFYNHFLSKILPKKSLKKIANYDDISGFIDELENQYQDNYEKIIPLTFANIALYILKNGIKDSYKDITSCSIILLFQYIFSNKDFSKEDIDFLRKASEISPKDKELLFEKNKDEISKLTKVISEKLSLDESKASDYLEYMVLENLSTLLNKMKSPNYEDKIANFINNKFSINHKESGEIKTKEQDNASNKSDNVEKSEDSSTNENVEAPDNDGNADFSSEKFRFSMVKTHKIIRDFKRKDTCKSSSLKMDSKLYTGYVYINKKNTNKFINFYPLVKWSEDDFSPLTLGNTFERRKQFPYYGNVVIDNDVPTSNLKSGTLINLYWIDISNNQYTSGEQGTQLSFKKSNLSKERNRPVEASRDNNECFRCYYVFDIDKNTNETFTIADKTWLSINGKNELPPVLHGCANSSIFVSDDKQNNKFYGPFTLHYMSDSKKIYIDLTREPVYKNGLIPYVKVRNESMDKAVQVHDIFDESEKTIENFRIIFPSQKFVDEYVEDILQDSDLFERLAQGFTDSTQAEFKSCIEIIQHFNENDFPQLFSDNDEINLNRKIRLAKILYEEYEKKTFDEKVASYICKLIPKIANDNQEIFDVIYERLSKDRTALELMSSHKGLVNKLYELEDIENAIVNKKSELNELCKKIDINKSIKNLTHEKQQLESKIKTLKEEAKSIEELESFDERLNNTVEHVAQLAFDGAVTSKILKAATDLEKQKQLSINDKIITGLKRIKLEESSSIDLLDILVERFQQFRSYDKNECINIFISVAQNFLTIISGEPGTGKTTLCNYLPEILGIRHIADFIDKDILNELQNPDHLNRYIPISVERGWTSKRDLIGYYNTLTQKFESTDPHRYECFKQLDLEKKCGFDDIPYFILLDEANLSPMEYYFADFMNICDDRGENSFISSGEGRIFYIPDTLRFVATINNDHTTEILSPRLIDRVSVVTLPDNINSDWSQPISASVKHFSPVSWIKFKELFGPRNKISAKDKSRLDELFARTTDCQIRISHRSKDIIRNYVSTASSIFDPLYGIDSHIHAFDFAIAQKVLPQISGNGEKYRESLQNLLSYLEESNYSKSTNLLKKIIENGDENMNYYRFF